MDLIKTAAIATELMAKHGLTADGWTFRMDRAQNRLGLCQYAPQIISMGAAFVLAADEAAIRETLLHEIAHALVGPYQRTSSGAIARDRRGQKIKAGHGWQWKLKAREIGYTGGRTGSNPAADARADDRHEFAKKRAEAVAHIVDGPLQLGELVQTRDGRYRGLLTKIDRVNGTIMNERDALPWKIAMTDLYRSIASQASGSRPYRTTPLAVTPIGTRSYLREPVAARGAGKPTVTPRITFRKGDLVVINKPSSKYHGTHGVIIFVGSVNYKVSTIEYGPMTCSPSLVQAR